MVSGIVIPRHEIDGRSLPSPSTSLNSSGPYAYRSHLFPRNRPAVLWCGSSSWSSHESNRRCHSTQPSARCNDARSHSLNKVTCSRSSRGIAETIRPTCDHGLRHLEFNNLMNLIFFKALVNEKYFWRLRFSGHVTRAWYCMGGSEKLDGWALGAT